MLRLRHAGSRAVLPSLLALLLMGARHPVHVSSTQIDLATDQRSLEVTIRVFTDDLESALKQQGRPVTIAGTARGAVDSALAAYVLPRVTFAANGTPPRRAQFVGYERDEDATLVFIEVPVPAGLRALQVTQPLLLELFDDQVNLLHLRAGTIKRSALIRRGAERGVFQW